MKTMRMFRQNAGPALAIVTVIAMMIFTFTTRANAQSAPAGGTPAAAAPTTTTTVGIGGACQDDSSCNKGLVCGDADVCRNPTAKERSAQAEQAAVAAADKAALAIANRQLAEDAVKAAREECKNDSAKCGDPVEQAEGHLRELQRTGSAVSTGTGSTAASSDVLAFQHNYGLVEDGLVGPKTCNLATAIVKVASDHPVAKACKAHAEAKTVKTAKKAAAVANAGGLTLDGVRQIIREEIAPIKDDIFTLKVRVNNLEHPVVAGADPS